MDRKARFPIKKYESLEAMKDEEYRYWQGRPAHERLAAVSEITAGGPDSYPGAERERLETALSKPRRV